MIYAYVKHYDKQWIYFPENINSSPLKSQNSLLMITKIY